MKLKAQNVIEFSFVFIVIMSIFLAIIELTLYWRAQFSVTNIANEIIANVQIKAQNTKVESEIVSAAQQALKKSAGLVNLSDTNFILSGSNGNYSIKSSFTKLGAPALIALINIDNLDTGDISVGVVYTYTGIFLYREGKAISSGSAQGIQKY